MMESGDIANKSAIAQGRDGKMTRSDARLIISALQKGWKIPQELMDLLPQKALETLRAIDTSAKGAERKISALMEASAKMVANNINIAKEADRMDRLDNDEPTENLNFTYKLSYGAGPAPRSEGAGNQA